MSKIEWTEQTWNPIVGCTIVSPGCTNCYAMLMAKRIERMGNAPHYAGLTKVVNGKPVWTGKLALAPDNILHEPLRRKKLTMYFVNSMGDLFHEDVPDAWIDLCFAIMALAPQHTFQVLTKRSARLRAYCSSAAVVERIKKAMRALYYEHAPDEGVRGIETLMLPRTWTTWVKTTCHPDCTPPCQLVIGEGMERGVRFDKHDGSSVRPCGQCYGGGHYDGPLPWPLPNVWNGVSAERPQEWMPRTADLRATPATVRFVSAEPLLAGLGDIGLAGIDWIIVGGESGPGARALWVPNVRSIVRQCRKAGVAVFVKQLGAYVCDRNDAGFDGCDPHEWPEQFSPGDRIEEDLDGTRDGYQGAPVRIRLSHRKGADMSEWPPDLRVREMPGRAPPATADDPAAESLAP